MKRQSILYRALCLATLAAGLLAASVQSSAWAQNGSPLVAQEPKGELKTLAVIAVNSYEEIVADITFSGSLADRPESGQMVEGMIALFTQGKGLAGVNKSSAWGIVVQTDGEQILPIGCLPVTSLDELVGLAAPFGVEVEEQSDGIKVIKLPNQQSIYVKAQGGWAFVSAEADSLAYAPNDPSTLLGKLVADYDIAARISVTNTPEMYKQQAIAAFQSGIKEGTEKRPEEDEATYQARKQLADMQMQQVTQMVEDLDEVTIGWSLDSKQQRSLLDFTYTFLPDTKMAKQLTSYGQPQTNFAGFFQSNAAASMSFASKTDPALIQDDLAQFKASVDAVREQTLKAIDEEGKFPDDATRDAAKAAVNDVIEAVEATIASGEMDGAGSLNLTTDKISFVGGMKVKEPAKIESALKKLATVAEKEPEFGGVKWNAAKQGDVNFHTFAVPLPPEVGQEAPEVRKLFGEKVDVAIGIGPSAVFVALGSDDLTAVNAAIEASQADANKAVPPFEFSLSLGEWMAFAAAHQDDPDQKPILQSIADMLQGEAKGRDHVRMVGQFIPNGLRYRIEAEEGVLRAIGKATAEAQRQAQEAQAQ